MNHTVKVVVANSSRQIDYYDSERGWVNIAVESPNGLAVGVYPLAEASPVARDTSMNYSGSIVHVDRDFVYQSVFNGRQLAKHDVAAFPRDAVPHVGEQLTLRYDQGQILSALRNDPSAPTSFRNLPGLG